MKRENYIKKIEVRTLGDITFDLFITSSGFESRATYLVQKININASKKIAFVFDDKLDKFNRKSNDKILLTKGFELIEANGDSGEKIIDKLKSLEFNSSLNILVDYSSMTRIWYATILSFFNSTLFSDKDITLYFSYSCAQFVSPPDEIIPNINVGPITGYNNLSISNKPTILIIGLGYEIDRAYGLAEYLDAETYLFYTENFSDNSFSSLVEKNNEELIKSVSPENVFLYNIESIESTFFVLYNLCSRLIETNRIVLAPCGPKLFTMFCLITSHMLLNVDVWRISPGKKSIPLDRIPNGEILVFKTKLTTRNFI